MTPPTATPLTVAHHRNVPSPLVIVAAITAMVCIAVGALVIGEFAPAHADTAVVTGFVLGTVAPTIMGLLALLRGDHAVRVSQDNAQRLVETSAKVAEVAENVNGHLERHDDLAETLTHTADSLAKLATNTTPVARAGTARTRSTDAAPTDPAGDPLPGDSPPLDQAQA